MQCRGIEPHLTVRGKSQCFSLVVAGTLVYYRGPAGMILPARVCPSYKGHLRNFLEAWQGNRDASRDEAGDHDSLSSCHNDIGIFNKSQALSPFQALNFACLSRCQTNGRPPVQMRQRPGAFSKVYTGNSDIPSYCEMKDESAFKPLQGHLSFFRVRASWCPFHLRQQTQSPSPIPIAEGSLHLTSFWKFGLSL